MIRWLILILLSWSVPAALVRAEPVRLSVFPESLNAGQSTRRGPHEAAFDPDLPANGLLLVTLGGTNSLPSDFRKIADLAVSMGYHAIGIDYSNTTISTSCRHSWTPGCFDRFRSEITTGEIDGEFPAHTVDRANSIEGRILSLLGHLAVSDSRWSAFLRDGRAPRWDRVVLIGHSQGSGHAAFLAKRHPVHRVIMLAGPQDHGPDGIADWVLRPGLTPPERHFAFLHEKDFFGVREQLDVNRALMGLTGNPPEETAFVEEDPPSRPASVVVSRLPLRDPHMEVMHERFRKIWAWLLSIPAD